LKKIKSVAKQSSYHFVALGEDVLQSAISAF